MMVTSTVYGYVLALAVCVGALSTEEGYKRSRFFNARNITARQFDHCTQAQSNIDFNELLGLWNVIEVIEHSERYTDRRNYLRTVANSDSCPVVHFAQEGDRVVRMLWNEEGGYIQFDFRLTNINNPGFWMSTAFQTGTLLDNNYDHFSGTVQVVKAVQSHLVLTFCSPMERHFSIILARNKYLHHEELRGVHKQLHRVNLPLVNIQSYCKNAAGLTASSMASLLLAVVVSCRHWLS